MKEHATPAGPDSPRDPVLDRAYAAGALEEPPARLDAAILAAARREVRSGPQRPGAVLRAWRVPVALAAVLVLSVSVVLLLREEGADRLEDGRPPAAAPAPAAADSATPAEPKAPQAKPEPAQRTLPRTAPGEAATRYRDARVPQPGLSTEEGRSRKQETEPGILPEPSRRAAQPFAEPPAASAGLRRSAPAAAPPAAGNLAKEVEPGAGAEARGAIERAAPASPQPAPSAAEVDTGAVASKTAKAAADAAVARPALRAEQQLRDEAAADSSKPVWQGFERQPPEKWLERVAELRRGGREADARQMLAEFRKRFPEYPVPSDLAR